MFCPCSGWGKIAGFPIVPGCTALMGGQGVIITVFIDGGTLAIGVAGLALVGPPIGGTIATGSFCIRDIVLLMGGTVTIGVCRAIAVFIGGTAGNTWFRDGLPCKSIGEVVLSKPP